MEENELNTKRNVRLCRVFVRHCVLCAIMQHEGETNDATYIRDSDTRRE